MPTAATPAARLEQQTKRLRLSGGMSGEKRVSSRVLPALHPALHAALHPASLASRLAAAGSETPEVKSEDTVSGGEGDGYRPYHYYGF